MSPKPSGVAEDSGVLKGKNKNYCSHYLYENKLDVLESELKGIRSLLESTQARGTPTASKGRRIPSSIEVPVNKS